jgi:tetratricopeptide (TPR) repeat protein
MIDAEDAKWHCRTVFPTPIFARFAAGLSLIALSACSALPAQPKPPADPALYPLLMAELAIARGNFPVAAQQYAKWGGQSKDAAQLARATGIVAQAQQPTLTLKLAQRWIALDGRSAQAMRAAANAELSLYRPKAAARHFKAFVDLSHGGPEGALATIDADLDATDNPYAARGIADRLAGYFPRSPAALRLKALRELRADDARSALASFQSASSLSASADLTWALLRAQVLTGEPAAALDQAQRLMATQQGSALRLDYALLLLAARRNDAARAQFALLEAQPQTRAQAQLLAARLDLEEGRLDEAARGFAQLITSGSFIPDSCYYLGLIAERRNDSAGALQLYSRVTGGDNMLPALLRAAGVLRNTGAAVEADELMDRLIEDAPNRAPQIIVARARLYDAGNESKRALKILEAGMVQYPDSVELRYARASTLEALGRVSEAVAQLESVWRLRREDPAAQNALGYTLADHSLQLARARRLIEQAHAAAPQSAAIGDSLGWVLFRQGHAPQALPYLNAALAAEDDAEIAAHLGEVLWSLGRKDEAERIWSQAAKSDPDDKLLRATAARLGAKS